MAIANSVLWGMATQAIEQAEAGACVVVAAPTRRDRRELETRLFVLLAGDPFWRRRRLTWHCGFGCVQVQWVRHG